MTDTSTTRTPDPDDSREPAAADVQPLAGSRGHGETNRPTSVRIGEWWVDLDTGDLQPVAGNGRAESSENEDGAVHRQLQPKPTRLLAILAEVPGQLVTHETLRRELWPETHVEYEDSIHHCVRQLRRAFEDDARAPRYVESLPRRGYRLIATVDRDEGRESQTRDRRRVHRYLGFRPIRALAAGAVVALAAILAAGVWTESAQIGVAVAPFGDVSFHAGVPAGGGLEPLAPARVAARELTDRVTVALERRLGDRVRLLGPISTATFRSAESPLRAIGSELEVDWVLFGRLTRDSLLLEWIRVDDGDHVWVHELPADQNWTSPETADWIADQIAAQLGIVETTGSATTSTRERSGDGESPTSSGHSTLDGPACQETPCAPTA